jgi:uncharacterized protein (TIGR00730 family)
VLIGVYCGSSSGHDPLFGEAADALGACIAGAGHGIVYGGGRVGLMGRVADACLAKNGEVVGVITRDLLDKEVGHSGLTTLSVVDSMHERKAMMAERADAFVALPGGFGTLDELCEVLTWAQLGLHLKPIVLLDTKGYWQPFMSMTDRAIEEGFMPTTHRALVQLVDEAKDVVAHLEASAPATPAKWVDGKH